MHLSYDPEFNIAYIRFRARRARVRTVSVSDELNIDIGLDGRVYGIELLNANQQLGASRSKKLVMEDRRSGRRAELALAG